MRQLDLWFGDGDRRRLALAMVTWSWLLILPLLLGRWAVTRFGKPGHAAWALLVLAVLPVLGFSAGRSSGSDAAEELAFDAIGDSAAGEVGAVIALLTLLAVVLLLVTTLTSLDLPIAATGAERPSRLRALLRTLVPWTVFWALVAVLMATTVESYPTRGSWMATTAAAVSGGDDGVTGDFETGLETSRAEVVDCDEAAALLRVDGEQPELPGCRTAMVVEAVGRTGEGPQRRTTGALAAVVVQTRTPVQLDRLDDELDDVELADELAGDVADPLDTLVNQADAAYALVVATEDPGEAPLGEGAAQRPLTRALAYTLIGTASGFYPAPPPASTG